MPRKITTADNTNVASNTNNDDSTQVTQTKTVRVTKKVIRVPKTQKQEQTEEQPQEQIQEQSREQTQVTPVQVREEHHSGSDWEDTDNTLLPEVNEGNPVLRVSVKDIAESQEPETEKATRSTRPQYSRNNRTQQYQTQQTRSHQTANRQNTRPPSTRPKSAALSFSYNDYKSYNQSVNDATTPDLLRVLIVRAHEDGQVHLKRCLENTLRAVNLECKFPTLPPPVRRPNGGHENNQ